MRFYCEDHGKDLFVSEPAGRVECYTESEVERHYLGEFPTAEFWEYCCNCETAWRSGSLTNPILATQCPRCKSSLTVRYLCDKCSVFTVEAEDAFTGRAYMLTAGEAPARQRETGSNEPACPACLKAPRAEVNEHKCDQTGLSFWSARRNCPFCNEPIGPPPAFPAMAADFLDRIKSKNKIRVGFDVLEIESKLLVESSQGQFIVVVNGSRKTRSILLPKRTRFEGSDDRQLYSNCYDSEKTDDGDVRILSPAVVKKTREGWVLVERGRIEVVRPGSEISESPPAVPRRAADYLKQGTESTIVNFDPGKNLLVLDPDRKGSLTIVKSQSGENLLLPRVTEFLGTQGFQRYFSTYYQRFYDCPSLVAGDLWIVWPALVEKVKGGWRLTKKGALEIREEPAQREIKSEIQDDDQAPLSMKDHAHETSELTSTGDTSSSKPKYFLAALLAMSLVTIAVLAWRRYLTTNSVATSELRLRIEGGTFLMGSNDGAENERPQHSVTIKPFSIDTYEVTREEYEKFMQALNHKAPSGWINGKYPLNTARLPVTGIDWYDADAYCKWTGKRLPTEEEWELAARGFDGRKYPWGNDWKSGYANAENASTGLTDVDKFKGASPYGAIGMIGNAWEWTSSKLAPYPGGRLPPDELGNGQADLRVIRGGSWQSKRTSATTTYRWGWPASGGSDYANTGFRCVKDP